MPTYGYRCLNCHQEMEVLQKMSDLRLTVCPECQGELEKLLYPVGVQFKGSGFYSTDYRNKPKDSESSPQGGGKSEGANGSGEGAAKATDKSAPPPQPSPQGGGKTEKAA